MSRFDRKVLRAARVRPLRIRRLERADVERAELDPIATAMIADIARLHDDDTVDEDEFRARVAPWLPALDERDELSRHRICWTLFQHVVRSATGRAPTWREWLGHVNAATIRALAEERAS